MPRHVLASKGGEKNQIGGLSISALTHSDNGVSVANWCTGRTVHG
jgi:hypothetical protein